MPALESCCFLVSNRSGTIAIGTFLLFFTVSLLGVSVGFIAGWEHFDTSFLVDASNKLRSQCQEEDYVGNCTNREWVATKVDNLQGKLNNISEILREIGPVWKNEFISLFAFLPWYSFANVLLIMGAVKEIRILLVIWVVSTLVALVWEFVLLSILFSYDTTVGFVLTLAILQLVGFSVFSYFILIVFSFYQEMSSYTVKQMLERREDD
eukprot:TRINITY_DN29659_c0_g1_i1.p1 TRINITY_DN29659_c0_g1~~TRINITY_DN29659_c0_g1_i1.p1  ORF type:complete len:209 (-),score=46.39 TRINITY_DN29659_c0_g1_i1:191-817(-)